MRLFATLFCVATVLSAGLSAAEVETVGKGVTASLVAEEVSPQLEEVGFTNLIKCIAGSCLSSASKCLSAVVDCVSQEMSSDGSSIFGSWWSSIQGWFLKETGEASMGDTVKSLVKQCLTVKANEWLGSAGPVLGMISGALPEQGPYDDFVCDMISGAQNGFDFSDVSVGKIKECSASSSNSTLLRFLAAEAAGTTVAPGEVTTGVNQDTDCSHETMGVDGFKDFFKQGWAAVTGKGDSGVVGETVTSLKDCWSDKSVPKTTCIGAVLVGTACQSSCDMIDCEVRKLYAGGNKPCKEALRSTCAAAFGSANKLCSSMMQKVNLNSTSTCSTAKTCKDISGASPVFVVSIFSLVASMVAADLF